MNWADRIVFDPQICHGKPTIRGTRVLVSAVLDTLAENTNIEDLLQSYPSLVRDDVRAAIAYAAEIARERILPLSH